jgi:hypothetical protein
MMMNSQCAFTEITNARHAPPRTTTSFLKVVANHNTTGVRATLRDFPLLGTYLTQAMMSCGHHR